MIPVKDSLTQIDNLPGEEIEFAIGDPRFVMRANAKLYSDITTAIIREYSTNAHDAHVMAGNPDPIEVTLPSMMNPFFTVEDKGVGMDIEDFREIYTQFGTSNKRESNDTNGTLGFGSKSGVAYTTQFTVTSVKDGMKVHGVVMRKPDWSIVLKVVSTVKTDEPNGTKITIPVHNVDEFNHKANEFYKFWLPGRVLVNGKEPAHYVGEKIVDGLYFSLGGWMSYIVMGNVAYRINNPSALFTNTKMNQINFVAYVDNGDVEFTPSREDLEYTEHTKATLQKVVNDFENQILTVAEAEIEAATTHAEAYTAWAKWTDMLGKSLFDNLEFKGDKFVSDFNIKGTRYSPSAGYGRSAYGISKWNVEAMPRTVVVTEYDLTLSSRHKTMVRDYAKLKGWDMTYAIFTTQKADDIECPWITKDQFVTYETMKAELPKVRKTPAQRSYNNPNAGRIKGSWDYLTAAGRVNEKPLPDVEDGGEFFYIDLQTEKNYNVSAILRLMGDEKSVVVIVPGNRREKFLRENPEVKEFAGYAKAQVVTDAESLLSDEAKRVLSIGWNTRQWLRRLDMSKVDDTNLHYLAGLIADEKNLTKAYEDNNNLAQQCQMWYSVKHYNPTKETDSIFGKYPLLADISSYQMHKHTYLYLNAVNAAESEKKND